MKRLITIGFFFLVIQYSFSQRMLNIHAVKEISTGEITEVEFNNLKQLLSDLSKLPVKDTLFIKYDFNRETCWDMTDQKDDVYIRDMIQFAQQRVQETSIKRPGVSIFRLREKGNSINKLISRDGSILIDIHKKIFHLLFKKRSLCGSSIIILPDRRFILLRSDPHMEVLNFASADIEKEFVK